VSLEQQSQEFRVGTTLEIYDQVKAGAAFVRFRRTAATSALISAIVSLSVPRRLEDAHDSFNQAEASVCSCFIN
jgi:hypothetical protein